MLNQFLNEECAYLVRDGFRFREDPGLRIRDRSMRLFLEPIFDRHDSGSRSRIEAIPLVQLCMGVDPSSSRPSEVPVSLTKSIRYPLVAFGRR